MVYSLEYLSFGRRVRINIHKHAQNERHRTTDSRTSSRYYGYILLKTSQVYTPTPAPNKNLSASTLRLPLQTWAAVTLDLQSSSGLS